MSAEKLKGWEQFFILHPLYFGLFPILFFYATYAMLQMPPDVLVIPLAVQVIASTVVYIFFLGIQRFKNPEVAAIQSSAFWTAFYTLTYILILDKALSIFGLENLLRVSIPIVIAGVWTILLSLICVMVIKKSPSHKITLILNDAGRFLVILEILVIVGHQLLVNFMWEPQTGKLFSAQDNLIFRDSLKAVQKLDSKKPLDVYFILVDEFPSNFVLKQFYNYDNKPFLAALEKRGFVVAEQAHSNYPRTMLTLPSMLNMTYLNELASICGKDTTDWSLVGILTRKARAIELFKKAGYEYIHFGSATPPTDWNPYAQINFPCTYINTFTTKLILSSLPGLFSQTHEFLDRDERQQRLDVLSGAAQVPKVKGKKFIFVHLLMPHEPFIFGPNGEPVHAKEAVDGEQWSKETQRGFRDQAIFLESKLLETIDLILVKSDQRPIIIIQGDHGPNSRGFLTTPNPNKDVLVERYGILSAYLLPENLRSSVYDTISPVNVFRIILNDQLGTTFSNLVDTSYYSPFPYLCRFVDVTKQIKAQENILNPKSSLIPPGMPEQAHDR